MAMYECVFCGNEEGGFPEVIILLNSNLNQDIPSSSDWETLFNKLYEINKVNKEFSHWNESHFIAKTWDDFYHELHKHDLWFCSKECAMKYLEYGKSQWKLEKETNEMLEKQMLDKKPGER